MKHASAQLQSVGNILSHTHTHTHTLLLTPSLENSIRIPHGALKAAHLSH